MLIKRKSIEQAESSRRPARKPKFAPVTLSEQDGVRYLHFGTEWVQGAMRIRKPDWPELEYAQQMMAWMLFVEDPHAIVQLGLGAATLTKFSYRQFPQAQVTAVELNPSVIAICADSASSAVTTPMCPAVRPNPSATRVICVGNDAFRSAPAIADRRPSVSEQVERLGRVGLCVPEGIRPPVLIEGLDRGPVLRQQQLQLFVAAERVRGTHERRQRLARHVGQAQGR